MNKEEIKENLCACGCGQIVISPNKWGRKVRFIKGHHIFIRKGKTLENLYGELRANEIKQKMKNSCVDNSGENNPMYGKSAYNKGKTLEELWGEEKAVQIKEKMRNARVGKTYEELLGEEKAKELKKQQSNMRRGKKLTEETKHKMSEAAKGIPHSREAVEKMRAALRGRVISESQKQKQSIRMSGTGNPMYGRKGENAPMWGKRGQDNPNYGRKATKESKLKMSISRTGEKNPGWAGGVSYLPYPPVFNKSLKTKIRTRDNYICQNCGEFGNHVHHIDYDKQNCSKSNLITLCQKCHKLTYRKKEKPFWNYFYFSIMVSKGLI